MDMALYPRRENSSSCEVCITCFLAHFINDRMVRAASDIEIKNIPLPKKTSEHRERQKLLNGDG
jgi:hypothetical protein